MTKKMRPTPSKADLPPISPEAWSALQELAQIILATYLKEHPLPDRPNTVSLAKDPVSLLGP
ncbi:hypothetical protein CVU37_04815 [candidate division BRC1 bacterium HGW-BRC1-1]|jgi:hypothetical protein|nr:MAG: hypothetical protein CVU37_04815 [candidate division BRC1 bacterium HGW-BRC1-1]